MRDMDKNFEICQAIANYSIVLNETLDTIIQHLNNMDKSIINIVTPIRIVGKYTIGGKNIEELFDMLREEFNQISSLTK